MPGPLRACIIAVFPFVDGAEGQNGASLSRCPFLPATHHPTSNTSTAAAAAAVVGTADSGRSDALAGVVTSGGKGEARTVGEAQGKRLLLAELRLDGYPRGWTYKVSINQETLPPKKVPKWTVWLELPVGSSITLEARAATVAVVIRAPQQ